MIDTQSSPECIYLPFRLTLKRSRGKLYKHLEGRAARHKQLQSKINGQSFRKLTTKVEKEASFWEDHATLRNQCNIDLMAE